MTAVREGVLQCFMQDERALSQPDLEEQLSIPCDRVTIYRTLTTFLEKGIIHKVLDDGGVMRYALCNHECKEDDHHHDHVHFKCTNCHKTICIDQVHIPVFSLPSGYQMKEVNVLMQGICDQCNKA